MTQELLTLLDMVWRTSSCFVPRMTTRHQQSLLHLLHPCTCRPKVPSVTGAKRKLIGPFFNFFCSVALPLPPPAMLIRSFS
jgi:hypothetical protein